MRSTDRAESLIRLAAPEAEYGIRAEADLARILACDPVHEPTRRPKPRQRALSLSLVAGLVVIAVALSIGTLRPHTAYAATPPMLASTPITGSASDILTTLADLRMQDTAPTTSTDTRSWALSVEVDADGVVVPHPDIEPYRYEMTFHDDGSTDLRITAGQPFPGQDAERLPPPGTLIAQEHEEPGTSFADLLPSPFPTDPTEVGAWLANFAGDPQLTAGQTFNEIQSILIFCPITPAQEAAILRHLAQLGTIQVLGDVTDRLHRQGIAFIAKDRDPGQYEDILIISPETGSIIAGEIIYVGNTRTDIPAPTVIDYNAWTRN